MFLVALLFAQNATAFEFLKTPTGSLMAWDTMPVSYSFNTNGSPGEMSAVGQENALNAALDAWTQVDRTDIQFAQDDTSSNTVYWTHDWPFDPDVLAITSNWTTDSGVMIGFTITLNANITDWTLDAAEGRDLQNALTHEVGHVLGLDHNMESLEATMFPTSESGDRKKRDLFWDDEDGVHYLYPTPEVEPFPIPIACNSTSSGGLLFGLIPLLVALTRRKESLS